MSCAISPSPSITQFILPPSVRWHFSNAFPRLLRHHQSLTISVATNDYSTGGEVSGSLSLLPSSSTFGIIASEWAEWLPALAFVPIKPLWVWIFNKT